MSLVLPDTSIWIDFFRGNAVAAPLDYLIESGRIVTNDLILAELIPSIEHKGEHRLRELMYSIEKVAMAIEWTRITAMQRLCLANGQNNVGIADLIIVQNAIDHDLTLFENDKHFRLMPELFGLTLFRDSGPSSPS